MAKTTDHIQQLHAAISAICPIDGVALDFHTGNHRVDYRNEATQQQRSAASSLLASWDFSDSAYEARALVELRNKAHHALDNQRDEFITIQRASLVELVEYANDTRAAFNSLLQWLGGQVTLTNRNQLAAMQRSLATKNQAFAAIKQRLAAGEGD